MAEEEIEDILEILEERLRRRIPVGAKRSPETLLEELEALESVIDLKRKLQAG